MNSNSSKFLSTQSRGFTLAEVLITMTVIGVIAVLTLPGLMSNIQEQQARTALKKMMNTLTLGAQMQSAVAGYDYSGVVTESDATDPNLDGSLLGLLSSRANVDLGKKFAVPTNGGGCPKHMDMAVYLRDGTAIYFNSKDVTYSEGQNGEDISRILDDGIMDGIPVIIDINGSKGPNLLSTCTGTVQQNATLEYASLNLDDAEDCTERNKRVIKDQYLFKLRGNFVSPYGAAAVWMMDETRPTADDHLEYSVGQGTISGSAYFGGTGGGAGGAGGGGAGGAGGAGGGGAGGGGGG